MKIKKILAVLLVILLIATLIFIWGNSIQSVAESAAKSKAVLAMVTPILERFVGVGNVTDHIVRKIAHFIEFCTLGGGLALLTAVCCKIRLQALVNCLFIGLAAAVTDESIQIFVDRGDQVSDILLDFSGVCVGLIIGMIIVGIIKFIIWLIRRVRRREPAQDDIYIE